jgi:hypothetical protein
MATKALKARLRTLESRAVLAAASVPYLFLKIRDSGIPDPSLPHASRHEYSDSTIVGYRTGGGRGSEVVSRLQGETIEEFESRAVATHPENVVFFAMYDDGALH